MHCEAGRLAPGPSQARVAGRSRAVPATLPRSFTRSRGHAARPARRCLASQREACRAPQLPSAPRHFTARRRLPGWHSVPAVSARRSSAPLSAAVRALPPRSAPFPSPAPLLSRLSACCSLPAPRCSLPGSRTPRPAGWCSAKSSGFARAPAVCLGRSRAGSALALHPPFPEFRLRRATLLLGAPQAPDADTGLHLARLLLPPLVRTAVAAAQQHGPVAPTGHAPSVCRHLPLCREHLESPCASVFGGSGAEKEAPGGGGNETGAPTAPAPQD
ncbi:uncharacterized protein LOC134475314 [Cavia porcellus]|uniref:uncharacterized protein LOC134475314 n=1 Tax=Cavia porcellus TaxID=10141 RepID=UPI002FE1178B